MYSLLRSSFDHGAETGKVLQNMSLIQRGVRAVAQSTVGNDILGEIRKMIESPDPFGGGKILYLEYPSECSDCRDTRTDIYLFKHPHLKPVIEFIQKHKREWRPKFTDWVNGHLFGYGEEEIGQHIERMWPF